MYSVEVEYTIRLRYINRYIVIFPFHNSLCVNKFFVQTPDLKVLSPSERVGVAEYAMLRKSRGVCSSIAQEIEGRKDENEGFV